MKLIKTVNRLVPLLVVGTTVFQTYILNKQTDILQAQISASIVLKNDHIFDASKNSYSDETLSIVNLGAPINNFEHDIMTFLKITKSNLESGIKDYAYLKINYFSISSALNGGQGELVLLSGNDNNLKLSNLTKLVSSNNSDKIAYEIDLITSIKINYLDLNGNVIENYFINNKLTNKLAFEKLANHRSINILTYELEDVNYNLITELFNKQNSDIISN